MFTELAGPELQKKSVMTEGNATGERDREMEERENVVRRKIELDLTISNDKRICILVIITNVLCVCGQ